MLKTIVLRFWRPVEPNLGKHWFLRIISRPIWLHRSPKFKLYYCHRIQNEICHISSFKCIGIWNDAKNLVSDPLYWRRTTPPPLSTRAHFTRKVMPPLRCKFVKNPLYTIDHSLHGHHFYVMHFWIIIFLKSQTAILVKKLGKILWSSRNTGQVMNISAVC